MTEQLWLQPDLLPEHPFPGQWAYLEAGKAVPTTLPDLLEKIRRGRGRVPFSRAPVNIVPVFVACPDSARFVPASDVPVLRSDWLEQMAPNVQDRIVQAASWFPLLPLLLTVLARFDEIVWVDLVLFFTFLALPTGLYLWGRYERESEARWADSLRQAILFHYWSTTRQQAQRSRAGWLFGGWGVVLVAQWLVAKYDSSEPGSFGTVRGALDPELWQAEPWRLLTAPMLHVGLYHLLGNALLAANCLWFLDVTRFRFLGLTIWILGAIAGSLLSAPIGDAPSVGASGGVMALFVFLLTLTIRNLASFPKFLLRSLLVTLCLIVGLGVLGWEFIDNAAHLGGALVGLAMAFALQPKGLGIWVDGNIQAPPGWSRVVDVAFLAMVVLAIGVVLAPLW